MNRIKVFIFACMLGLTLSSHAGLRWGHLIPKQVHLRVHNQTSDFWVSLRDLVHHHPAMAAPGKQVSRKYIDLIPSFKLSYAESAEGPFKRIPGCVEHMFVMNRNVTITVSDTDGQPHCDFAQ